MEILKKSESFNLSDITYQFETKGEVVYTPQENLQVCLNVSTLEGNHVGTCIYTRNIESDDISITLDVSKPMLSEFIPHINTLITNVVSNLKELN